MFRRIFRYPTEVRFDDMITVEEGEFAGCFDPDLSPFYQLTPIRHERAQHMMGKRQSGPTLYLAYLASQSRLVTPSLNFPVLENLPKHVPREMRFGRAIEVARWSMGRGR